MDEKIAYSIKEMFNYSNGRELFETATVTINKDGVVHLVAPELVTQYYLRKNEELVVDIPKLNPDNAVALAQIALAVGRRLERFERGRKANASRTTESRRKVAQNAIQTRWSAK